MINFREISNRKIVENSIFKDIPTEILSKVFRRLQAMRRAFPGVYDDILLMRLLCDIDVAEERIATLLAKERHNNATPH